MSVLSWNEIKSRAYLFSKEWENETSESAEAKSFWDDFFNVFGISRRRVATFEKSVKKVGGEQGYVDLFWKGVMLVEHKSRGKNLEKAYNQAKDYFPGIKESELPKYILVSDFEKFVLYDLDDGGEVHFKLNQLSEHIELFGFIAGYHKQEIKPQDPVNIEAAEKMGELHDKLKDFGYVGHDLEVLLVRLLFCLFADDTGIFEKNLFREYIEEGTNEDGSDLGFYLVGLFDTLNTSVEGRQKNIDISLNRFPYVNGSLFEERLRVASFDSEMRELLLESSLLDWGRISPAIFGSLFQSVMDAEARRAIGAHYTSEENILKVIKPLFLDALWTEFNKLKNLKTLRVKRFNNFHDKLASLKFLDPACGCGNFLVITYRELRLLELEVIKEIMQSQSMQGQLTMEIDELLVKLDVDQFYGIEIEEFPSQIAQVAMWLIDHQMNMMFSKEFGEYFVRLPLKKAPHIVHDNALHIDWKSVVPNNELNYILGNPPFIGARLMDEGQKKDIQEVAKGMKSIGSLDFVAGWFIKAADYIRFTKIKVGLVSTNSVSQGDQAVVLWRHLMQKKDVEIHFGHQTFKWTNEAKGKAAVYCVIIGFSSLRGLPKELYTYPDITGEPTKVKSKQINQYLLDAPTIFVGRRSKPLSTDVPSMVYGSTPIDGGNFIFTQIEMDEFIYKEPSSEKYFRPLIGSRELLYDYKRYCLYLAKSSPNELRKMPYVMEKVNAVKEFRSKSKRKKTLEYADYPTKLGEDRTVDGDILVIPAHTSENRKYIPIGYFKHGTIVTNSVFQVADADDYLFGILNSSMHMAWTKTVCGRLESRYRYSNTIVYNNFVFPNPSEKQRNDISEKAKKILDVRSDYVKSTLADLYDPLTTPSDLLKAHNELDIAVDKAYGKKFKNDEDRLTFLFDLYVKKTLPKVSN